MPARTAALAGCLLIIASGSCTSTDAADEGEAKPVLAIATVSTRPEYVTGGDVIVRVSGATSGEVSFTVNDSDTDIDIRTAQPVEGGFTFLVTGLRDGPNELRASDGTSEAVIEVVNHPTTGPLFSGPHIEPYVCTTERLGLGPPTDDDCSAPHTTTWSYVATDRSVKDLDDPSQPLPPDVSTTDVAGNRVPFVIRAEKGVINRGVYSIWALDPQPGQSWDPIGWNERLVLRFGGGCGTQYSQGLPLLANAGLDVDLLSRGYAVATNTLMTFQSNCNDVLTAETALMTKEHFAERFGLPRFTIGEGGSGGAIQQLLVAQNYPGILDGITPSLPFPDAISIAAGVTDCGLLQQWFRSEAGASLTPEQRSAVTGNLDAATCAMWDQLFVSGVNPRVGCHRSLDNVVYDPDRRRDGVRCTLQDINANIYGVDPTTGFARRALSNVGVQYGLLALRDGAIDTDQFLGLNEGIGSYDIDGNIVAERTPADLEAVRTSYATGRVLSGGGLHDIPIVLRDLYTDHLGDIHTRVHAFAIRERLRLADGTDAPNLLLWTQPPGGSDLMGALMGDTGIGNGPVYLVDEWLTALADTDPGLPIGERLALSKPSGAVQRCAIDDTAVISGGWEIYDEPGPCADAYPVYGDPRIAAGAPIRNDVIACQLRPIDPADYPSAVSGDQRRRLEAVFPDGVCDWSKPSTAHQALAGTWLAFPHR